MKAQCRAYVYDSSTEITSFGGVQRFEFERETDLPFPDYKGSKVTSSAHYCPICFRLWAKLEIIGSFQCVCHCSPCEECNDVWKSIDDGFLSEYTIPGSILNFLSRGQNFDESLLDALPFPLLKREFDLHLRALAKELEPHGNSSTTNSQRSDERASRGLFQFATSNARAEFTPRS